MAQTAGLAEHAPLPSGQQPHCQMATCCPQHLSLSVPSPQPSGRPQCLEHILEFPPLDLGVHWNTVPHPLPGGSLLIPKEPAETLLLGGLTTLANVNPVPFSLRQPLLHVPSPALHSLCVGCFSPAACERCERREGQGGAEMGREGQKWAEMGREGQAGAQCLCASPLQCSQLCDPGDVAPPPCVPVSHV